MKLEGILTLVFRDKDTGEITRELTEHNTITNQHIEYAMITNVKSYGTNYARFGPNMFLCSHTPAFSDPDIGLLPGVESIGYTEPGITSPIFVPGTETESPYGQMQQRFDPPVSTITFDVIGLNPENENNGAMPKVQAYVKLASTCTQDPGETLDVFYRINYPYDYWREPSPLDPNTTGISGAQADSIAERFTTVYNQIDYYWYFQPNWNANLDFTRLASTWPLGGGPDNTGQFSGVVANTSHRPTHKFEVDTSIPTTQGVGVIVGYAAYGNTAFPWARRVVDDNDSPVQNIFGHSPAATKPFFDVTTQNTGNGTIQLNGDAWTNPDFPKLYKLDVTASGAIGVGTYQFQVRDHFGFALNTYEDVMRTQSAWNWRNNYLHDGMTMMVDPTIGDAYADKERPVFIKFPVDGTKDNLLAIEKTAIYPLSVKTEVGTGPSGLAFNVTNYPTFNPTNITQVTLDGSTIYVGCRDSGIYKIVDPLGTPVITHIDNTTTGLTGLASSECYGVVVGNSRLWAVFEGGLFSSVDGGANWVQATFTNATITADWWRVKMIQADPTHADQRLAILYEDPLSTADQMRLSMVWWDEVSTNDVAGPGLGILYRGALSTSATRQQNRYIAEEPWTWFTFFVPSPTQNKWGAVKPNTEANSWGVVYPTFLTFGTTAEVKDATSNSSTYQMYIDWELDESGDQCLLSINRRTYQYGYIQLYKDNDTRLENYYFQNNNTNRGSLDYVGLGPVCYLGNLTTLGWNTSASQYFLYTAGEPDDPDGGPLGFLLWDKYGWNGSAWEKDHVGSKTFHAAAEVLSDGVTVAFDDAGGTQNYVLDDYYTCGVLKGVWLDGATQLDHKMGLYFKKIVGPHTDLSVSTVPAGVNIPEVFRLTPDPMTWQDVNNMTIGFDYKSDAVVYETVSSPAYTSGLRSADLAKVGDIANLSAADTVHCRFRWSLHNRTGNSLKESTCGFSAAANVVGQPINKNTVEFGIEVKPTLPINLYQGDVTIIESGVTVPVVGKYDINTNSASSNMTFEVEILNDGTVNYYIWFENIRELLHTSATTAPIVDYVVDCAFSYGQGMYVDEFDGPDRLIWPYPVQAYSAGGRRMEIRVPADHYVALGSFVGSTGRYTPNFWSIDTTQNFDILIDGVPPSQVFEGDSTTVLLAGEIAVFPRQGYIRFSGSDVGKTISASYHVVTKE